MKKLMKIFLNFLRKRGIFVQGQPCTCSVCNVCEISFNIKIILQFDREDYQVH